MELISVIVPVYQVEQYLDRCIESIVSQTYRNLEIILVDDGSPDNCPAMCDAWAEKDNRIRVIHKPNGGLSDARNAGMEVATGDYIGFVDSDDWIAPEMYERLLDAIMQNESDVAACGVEMIWEDSSQRRMLTPQINCNLSKDEAQLALLEESKLKQPVWYKLYRRAVIESIPFEQGKCHEDVFWSYQAIGNANKVSMIDYIGYYYWQRRESIMGRGYSLKRLDAMEAYCKRYEYFTKEFPELVDKGLVSIWENCIYSGQMALTFLNREEQKSVFDKLKSILGQYEIKNEACKSLRFSHRVWINFARISLITVCAIKKTLRIGY